MSDRGPSEDPRSLAAELKDVEEALAAARTVIYRLNEAAERIRTARQWGTYDTWFGGGLFSSWVKRERVDDADLSMRSVDLALADLRTELADVGIVGEVGVGRLAMTMDVWFDNLVSDLMTQSRLRDAADRVNRVGTAMVRLQSQLERRQAEVRRLLDRPAPDLAAE
jgi:hypothetical protein